MESELQGLLGEIASMLQDESALIISQDSKGKRALLAPVNKHSEAQLAVIKFTADPQKIESINKNLKTKENVLRFTLLSYMPQRQKSESLQKPPQLPQQKRQQKRKKWKLEILIKN